MDTSPREVAVRRVHQSAIVGGIFAALPLPITSAVLTAIELRLGTFIARTYKAPLTRAEAAAAGVGLSLMGRGLKRIARSASGAVPMPFGLLIRVAIAAGTIEALGQGLVLAYEYGKSDGR
jgi:uncharacterized protein (DUF697 family)